MQLKSIAAALASGALVFGCSQPEWEGASGVAEVQRPVSDVLRADLDLEHDATINESLVFEPDTGNGFIVTSYLKDNGDWYTAHWENAGLPVSIAGSRDYLHYLSFKILQQSDPCIKGRSELRLRHDVQFTDDYYYYLGFRIMVPSTTTLPPAHETGGDDYMYFQQFWQCSGNPPIAGLALSRDAYKALTGEPVWEPGRPFAWSMVVRTDSNGPTQGCHTSDEHTWAPFSGLLMPDVWHTFVLRIQIRPEGGGSVKMWQDGIPLNTFPTDDCQHTQTWYGPIGYDAGVCSDQRAHAKIGIYRANATDAAEIRFDDIRLAKDFHLAKPW